jgi:hypothetical protein
VRYFEKEFKRRARTEADEGSFLSIWPFDYVLDPSLSGGKGKPKVNKR